MEIKARNPLYPPIPSHPHISFLLHVPRSVERALSTREETADGQGFRAQGRGALSQKRRL